jgi:hypothetical protein
MSTPTLSNLSGTGAPKPGETGVVRVNGAVVGTGPTGGYGQVTTGNGTTYHPTSK